MNFIPGCTPTSSRNSLGMTSWYFGETLTIDPMFSVVDSIFLLSINNFLCQAAEDGIEAICRTNCMGPFGAFWGLGEVVHLGVLAFFARGNVFSWRL